MSDDAPLVRPPGKTVHLEGRIVSVEKRQPPRIDEEPDPRDAEIARLRSLLGEAADALDEAGKCIERFVLTETGHPFSHLAARLRKESGE